MKPLPLIFALLCAPACRGTPTANPTVVEAADTGDAIALMEALESLIDRGAETDDDRDWAVDRVRQMADDGSAAYAYARATLVGRAAELRGLKALGLLDEMHAWVGKSIERDPDFRGGAARRMLGTLYVLAGDHIDGGDSEEGLEILEALVDEAGTDPVHRLRLAEGYVFLGDPDPAVEHLCVAREARGALRPEELSLLDRLLAEVGADTGLDCAGG